MCAAPATSSLCLLVQSQADLAAERVAASALLEEELRREVASSQQAKPEAEAQQKSADKKVAAKVQQKLASLVGEVKALKVCHHVVTHCLHSQLSPEEGLVLLKILYAQIFSMSVCQRL